MPQVWVYSAPFATYNPGFTGIGWDTYGPSDSHSDYSNNTGVRSGDLAGAASYEHILTLDDGAIPVRSTFQFVRVRYTLGQSDLGEAGGLSAVPYLRYENSPPIYQDIMTPPYLTTYADYLATFTRDPNGYPWSRYSIFGVRGRRLMFGLRTVIPDPWLATARLYWSECRFEVGFTLPAPVVETVSATVLPNIANLAGLLDPRGATAPFPVVWYFQYGTTTAYGRVTASTGGVTGDGMAAVFANTGLLTPGLVYHYRLVATTAEGSYFGEDVRFLAI